MSDLMFEDTIRYVPQPGNTDAFVSQMERVNRENALSVGYFHSRTLDVAGSLVEDWRARAEWAEQRNTQLHRYIENLEEEIHRLRVLAKGG